MLCFCNNPCLFPHHAHSYPPGVLHTEVTRSGSSGPTTLGTSQLSVDKALTSNSAGRGVFSPEQCRDFYCCTKKPFSRVPFNMLKFQESWLCPSFCKAVLISSNHGVSLPKEWEPPLHTVFLGNLLWLFPPPIPKDFCC